ncbi:multi protein bridging factor 1-domain-containing protein [Jimgerdemannia flammicorona]|uniref:Multi protein bridging factor 1-domain-containing protein n=1 Tax=Jimgerdemannia flammicorona TaxID=994334 RepID=A0A433D2Z7_9FUNG|nr:multi protein bridging factor 1-domain-containing protein [Jimgerdemannia flammicorona]
MSDDWDSVTVIRKRADHAKVTRSQSDINAARRVGAVVATEKKTTTTNKGHAPTDHQRIAKLDRENEVAPPPKVDMSVGRAIQQGRQALGLTQKDLAQKINEKPQVRVAQERKEKWDTCWVLRGFSAISRGFGGPMSLLTQQPTLVLARLRRPVNEYEAGRAIPNQQILGKLERALGIKLRGKDIGSPLGGPKKG